MPTWALWFFGLSVTITLTTIAMKLDKIVDKTLNALAHLSCQLRDIDVSLRELKDRDDFASTVDRCESALAQHSELLDRIAGQGERIVGYFGRKSLAEYEATGR